ncbi:PR domain zinc finger protein 10-like [Portunus trituberculatus]|uniref:Uncharacterized protein n=1 Tax=Portunus trituberculatus TaxID=210409 RepID=A0A5B7DSL8_PORTR|nr:PR domain zinc finger protein 10-like [Portunus trituberculatus]MPC24059.1 hypothetical protein [Portunus trituberculatus]
MNRWPEGLQQSAVGGDGPSRPPGRCHRLQVVYDGPETAAALASLRAPRDPDRENTDDSGMGADLEADERGPEGKEVSCDDDSDDDEDEEETETETESESENEPPKNRRRSSVGVERQRRPSYTCYHGAPLPRGGVLRVGRRPRPRPPRTLDMRQLAAGATVMLAPLTPELLR